MNFTYQRITLLLLLQSLFVCCIVISDLIGASLIIVGGFTVSSSIFVVPFIYLSLDTISEIYGKEVTKRCIYVGFVAQILTVIFIYLGGIFPSSPKRDLHDAYQAMFELTPRMVLGSIMAYFISSKVNLNLFHYLSHYTAIPFWCRSQISSLLGIAVDAMIFMGVFLYGVMSFHDLLKVTLTFYILKIVFLSLNIPLLVLVKKLLKFFNL